MQKSLHSANYKLFLSELKAARERAGLSQSELAAAVGEHQTFISKCETGVRRLDIVELHQWVAALGIDLTSFTAAFVERLEQHQPVPAKRRAR